MLKSMTGYGRGESTIGEKKVIAEVRSVNHRFLDISVKILRLLLPLEADIKKLVSSYTLRGKLDVNIHVESLTDGDLNVHINKSMTKHIYSLLQQTTKETGIPGEINLSSLLVFKDILFEEKQENVDMADYWNPIKSSLEQALQSIQQMQEAEGEEISDDIKQRLENIAGVADEINLRASESLAERQQALKERIETLCRDVEVDEARKMQEIAIIADRSDVTEELIRAKSHIKQFMQWLSSAGESVGRKLDFLIQEINREVNTIGSKASDAEISLKAVIIKNELEKIREQVQNIM